MYLCGSINQWPRKIVWWSSNTCLNWLLSTKLFCYDDVLMYFWYKRFIFFNRLWFPPAGSGWDLCSTTGALEEAESGQVCVAVYGLKIMVTKSLNWVYFHPGQWQLQGRKLVCIYSTFHLYVSLLQTWDVCRAAETEGVGESAPATAAAASAGLGPLGSSASWLTSWSPSPEEPPWHPRGTSSPWGTGPPL